MDSVLQTGTLSHGTNCFILRALKVGDKTDSAVTFLVGIDKGRSVVSTERGQQLASSLGILFREVNTKSDNIKTIEEVRCIHLSLVFSTNQFSVQIFESVTRALILKVRLSHSFYHAYYEAYLYALCKAQTMGYFLDAICNVPLVPSLIGQALVA